MATSLGGSINSTPLGSLRRQSFEDKLNSHFDGEGEEKFEDIDEAEEYKPEDQDKEPLPVDQSLDEVISNIFDEENYPKPHSPSSITLTLALLALILILAICLSFACLPLFTCILSEGMCIPQISIQLSDSAPLSKSALSTVRELFKVLSYVAMDFGDTKGEIDMLNTKFEDYYNNSVIDTFSEDTVYRLNFWGYCRMSPRDEGYFCMKSYGFDLLGIFVRDAGVQFAELTNTNVNIMGDSFAIAYELAIGGMSQLVSQGDNDGSMLDYAILLQKFSKGMASLVALQFLLDSLLLLGSFITLVLLRGFKSWSKKLVVSMTCCSFVSLLTAFFVCSLTYQYVLKISQLAQSLGILIVAVDMGFKMIWVHLLFEVVSSCLVVCLANVYRKTRL